MAKKDSQKNIAKGKFKAERDIRIGDEEHYHIANAPFTLADTRQFLMDAGTNLLAQTIFSSFTAYQSTIDDFFQNPLKKILLILGPNESGKTHLLRNLVLESNSKSWETFCINPSIADLPPQGLSKDDSILIFRDDIDWDDPNFLLSILQFVEAFPNIRLILTAHQSWKREIDQSIAQIKGLPGKVNYIELGNWTNEQLTSIFRLAANSSEVKHEQDIVRQFSNPYLLKYFGEAIAGNPKISVDAISRNFTQKVRRVFEHSLQPELDALKVPSFIAHLIFNRAYDHLLADFAAKMELELEVLQIILQRLKSSGVLRSISGCYFIAPEVKGDFYMAGELDSASNIPGLLDDFMKTETKNATQKIVQIAQFTTPKTREKLSVYLHYYLTSCEQQLRENPALLHRAHIGLAEVALEMEIRYGIQNATEAAFSLVTYAMLHKIQNNENAAFDIALDIQFTNKPQGDDYGRFLETAVHILRNRADYLSLLQVYWKSGYKTYPHNYQPGTLLTAAFRPFTNNKLSYQTGLQYARYWLLDSGDLKLRSMAVQALQVMLGAFFEHFSSEYSTITFGTDVVPNDAGLFELRTDAISLVEESLKNEVVILDGLKILDKIGEGERFHSQDDLFKLSAFPKIQAEIERCIPLIGEVLCTHSDFLVQKTAESTLLKWWLWGISISMEPYLLQFDRTPEYLLYRFLVDDGYMTENFAQMKSDAPADNRREWYWKHSGLKAKRTLGSVEQYKDLVQQLSAKYSTPEQIAQFIHDTTEKVSGWVKQDGGDVNLPIWELSQVAQSWAAVQTATFKALLADFASARLLPEQIRTDVETQMLSSGNYLPEDIALPLLARIPALNMAEMSQLVFLIQKQQPVEKEAWLTRMITEGQEPMLHDIASRLCHIFKQEHEVPRIAEMLMQLLSSNKITRENFFVGNAGHAYKHLFKHLALLPPDLDETLRRETFNWIKKMNRLDLREADVIRYCVRATDHLIELFDYRAEHYTIQNSLKKTEFQVGEVLMDDIIPSNELGRLFQTPENHRRFVDKIQKWQDVVPVYSPDWKNAYLNVHDPVSNKLWIVLHLQSALDEGDVNAIQTYCQYIPRNEDYILLMLKSWTKLLPTNADDDMCRILYSWATYSRRSGGFYPMDYNRYDRPKAIWDMVTKQPIFDTRLKMLVQRVGRELNEMWEKTEENK